MRQSTTFGPGNLDLPLGGRGATLWCCVALLGAMLMSSGHLRAQESNAQESNAQAENAPGENPREGRGAASAFQPGISLLSDATQGLIEIDDLPGLLQRWTRTSLSDLQHDEAMQRFFETQREKITQRLGELGLKSGIRLADLRDAVSGELLFAWMRTDAPQRPFSVVMLADTRGRDAQRQSMLSKIDQELRARQATVTQVDIRGHQATVYTLPQRAGQLVVDRLVVLNLNGRLIISDRVETVASLATAALSGSEGGLTQSKDFQAVFDQVREVRSGGEAVDEEMPRVRWFARPIGMGMIARELAGVDRGRKVDVLKLLRSQGFDAIQAAGGEIRLATDHYDLLHQGFVFAPPTAEGPERYEGAARALQFPNVEMGDPPAWVLPTAATFFQAHWKMGDAFWAIGSLVDEAMGDEVFRPMLEGIKEDPNGPQIDIANDVVANLAEDLYIMTDNRINNGTTQERVVGAIHLANSDRVAEVINEAMKREPFVFRYPYDDHIVWEVRPEEVDVPTFDVTGLEDLGLGLETQQPAEAGNTDPLLDKWAITVFDEYLMFASHADLLVDVIEHSRNGGKSLADDATYIRVRDAILREGGEMRSMQRVVQTDLAWRVKYQLLRDGRFLQSDSILATLIRRAKERAEKAERPEQDRLEIDMSQLPPFEQIRQHLQPSGGFVQTQDAGWAMTQFLLRKE